MKQENRTERELRSLFSDAWLNDVEWAAMGASAAFYLLILPIRPILKDAAEKFRNSPLKARRRQDQIFVTHLRKLANDPSQRENLRWLQDRIREGIEAVKTVADKTRAKKEVTGLSSSPARTSQKIIESFRPLLPVLRAMIAGQPVPEVKGKEIVKIAKAITAERAGAKRKDILDAAKQLVDSGDFRGRNHIHRVCIELESQACEGLLNAKPDDPIRRYSELSPPERTSQRQRIRSGLYRRSGLTK